MATTKRCPNCGASNPESAEWCSLCLERFPDPEPEPGPKAEPGAQAEPVEAPPIVDEPPGEEGSEPAPARSRSQVDTSAFEVTEEGIRWICATCGISNPIDATECAACGTTFAEIMRPKRQRAQGDPGKAALYSLFFPGAGHAYLGMWGQAVARGVLSMWVLLVTVIGLVDNDVPGSLAMAGLFGIAALALWGITAHDAFREAGDEDSKVLLRGRRFLYVVLGLMAMLFVVMLVGLLSARSRVESTALSIPAWRSTSSPIFTELPTI